MKAEKIEQRWHIKGDELGSRFYVAKSKKDAVEKYKAECKHYDPLGLRLKSIPPLERRKRLSASRMAEQDAVITRLDKIANSYAKGKITKSEAQKQLVGVSGFLLRDTRTRYLNRIDKNEGFGRYKKRQVSK